MPQLPLGPCLDSLLPTSLYLRSSFMSLSLPYYKSPPICSGHAFRQMSSRSLLCSPLKLSSCKANYSKQLALSGSSSLFSSSYVPGIATEAPRCSGGFSWTRQGHPLPRLKNKIPSRSAASTLTYSLLILHSRLSLPLGKPLIIRAAYCPQAEATKP